MSQSHCVRPATLTCAICHDTVDRTTFKSHHLPMCQAARDAAKQRKTTTATTATVASTSTTATTLHTMSYEVFGKVQRVWMRKHTVQTGLKYRLTGYVFNTENGTVKGKACGTQANLMQFKKWLSTKGSPKARIERAECTKPRSVQSDPFGGVFIKKTVTMSNGTQWATRK
jgi:acylphosphatase